jgi:hypothetical protein
MDGRPGYHLHPRLNNPPVGQFSRLPLSRRPRSAPERPTISRLASGKWTCAPTIKCALTEWLAYSLVLDRICPIFIGIQSFALGSQPGESQYDYVRWLIGTRTHPTPTTYPEAMLAAKVEVGKERSWVDAIRPVEFTWDSRFEVWVCKCYYAADSHNALLLTE